MIEDPKKTNGQAHEGGEPPNYTPCGGARL